MLFRGLAGNALQQFGWRNQLTARPAAPACQLMAMLEEDIRSAARVRLSTALAAAPAAEALLRDLQYGDLEVRSKSTASDLVTRADLESEQALLGAIRRDWPNDAILAEESGRSGGAQGDFSWAVDPLDGTVNYAHGLPLYSISIGIL